MAFFSTNSADYLNKINSLVKPTYESKYDGNIANIMDKISNRENFSYDFNSDALYQNYKDNYTKLGNEAAMNAAAAVSAQTGGYGNSYAASAASQANQQYLTQLNSVIPDLYNAAMNKYQMETENLYNQFGMYETEESRQYGQYRDNVSDYYSDWSNLLNGYGIAQAQENADRSYNYQVSRDAVADSQWKQSFDMSNAQWLKNFNYNASRDAVADSQWQKEYELALKKASNSGSGSSSKTAATNTNAQVKASDNQMVYKNTERSNTIKQALDKSDDPVALLAQIAAADSAFTEGDYTAFRNYIKNALGK